MHELESRTNTACKHEYDVTEKWTQKHLKMTLIESTFTMMENVKEQNFRSEPNSNFSSGDSEKPIYIPTLLWDDLPSVRESYGEHMQANHLPRQELNWSKAQHPQLMFWCMSRLRNRRKLMNKKHFFDLRFCTKMDVLLTEFGTPRLISIISTLMNAWSTL